MLLYDNDNHTNNRLIVRLWYSKDDNFIKSAIYRAFSQHVVGVYVCSKIAQTTHELKFLLVLFISFLCIT